MLVYVIITSQISFVVSTVPVSSDFCFLDAGEDLDLPISEKATELKNKKKKEEEEDTKIMDTKLKIIEILKVVTGTLHFSKTNFSVS